MARRTERQPSRSGEDTARGSTAFPPRRNGGSGVARDGPASDNGSADVPLERERRRPGSPRGARLAGPVAGALGLIAVVVSSGVGGRADAPIAGRDAAAGPPQAAAAPVPGAAASDAIAKTDDPAAAEGALASVADVAAGGDPGAPAAAAGPAPGPPPPWTRYDGFRGPPDATLVLEGLHVGERLSVRPFGDDGAPDPEAFEAIDHLLRCRRTERARRTDPRLVVLLADLQARLRVRAVHVVSGYRAPGAGHTSATSFHVRGMAADVRVPGVGPWRLYAIAERLGAGGVGLYPRRGERFVHVDVREDPTRWRQKWNRRNAYRRVRHAGAHRERMARWALPE